MDDTTQQPASTIEVDNVSTVDTVAANSSSRNRPTSSPSREEQEMRDDDSHISLEAMEDGKKYLLAQNGGTLKKPESKSVEDKRKGVLRLWNAFCLGHTDLEQHVDNHPTFLLEDSSTNLDLIEGFSGYLVEC